MMLMNVDVLPRAESLICTIRQQCRKLFNEILFLWLGPGLRRWIIVIVEIRLMALRCHIKGEKDDDIADTKNSAKKNEVESYKTAGTKESEDD